MKAIASAGRKFIDLVLKLPYITIIIPFSAPSDFAPSPWLLNVEEHAF
jgi:hypothetical protein